ncbi:MAG: hypothetical protein ACO1SX_19580 [Actinomycetota bacterium]
MSTAALKVMALNAALDPADLLRKEPRLRIEGGRLYLSEEGLAMVLPPGMPIKLERITPGVLYVRLEIGIFSAPVQARASATGEGLLRLEIGGLIALIMPAIKDRVARIPGVRSVEGSRILIDLAEIVALKAPVELPPLKAVRIGQGVVELEF